MRRIHRNLQTNSASPAARISDQLADFADIPEPAPADRRTSVAPAAPGLVRFGRTPDKVRRQEVERAAAEPLNPPPEPVPEAPAEAERVRFWRTPRHMMQQVWGGASAEVPGPEMLPQLQADIAGEGDEALTVSAIDSPAEKESPPEAVTTPFAFLSDAAFWEFIPDAEQEDEAAFESAPLVLAPMTPPELNAPVVVAEPVRAVPAQALAAVSAAMSFGWTQPYRFDLSFAQPAPPVAMPAPVFATPVRAPKAPAPAPAPRRRIMGQLAPAAAPVPKVAEAEDVPAAVQSKVSVVPPALRPRVAAPQPRRVAAQGFELPPIEFLAEPPQIAATIPIELIQQNSGLLEGILEDFNVRGEVVQACPGPVVTLYELEPAPGTKSSRVISLADDIARSMSAISARVAVVQGKNAIGIELPNAKRETVFLRELLASQDFEGTKHKLALCLGKTIGGEPVIADLARMPHLLVAGTTGSGKSVAINTMILSILYRLKPEECRLIMVDPKMLELSVYDGIPHLLTPVVTDPKKAVVALKWAVREMEERYKKMSKLGVRNIDGFNVRVGEALAAGEVITRTVQTGFDKHSGEAIYEEEAMDLSPLPYIVVIVDEMADLMMVAGKEIEGTIQRLAQMARAAGIHVVLATQRPSVDVITGTIKANFPTRISFQVTSKIDSRTILGEMGAEQLLGQGDMLYMAGGGRITRVHGPFVSDAEVEKVVAHLKTQGRPDYLDAVTAEDEAGTAEDEDGAVFDKSAMGAESDDPYEQAVAVVLRDKKASTSYIQRRLQIGYNRAASIMERMENEGIVGPANHAGKREILVETGRAREDED
ncbi:DNA translocase FtsK [Bosea sp. LjRoot237]|uniref:DNA translocase FtsK n=1 Tax=Bosea sp. LjRoot237 TaxID=3342292 RepID=UPI003ED0F911